MNPYFGAKIDRASLIAEKAGKIVRMIFVLLMVGVGVLGAAELVINIQRSNLRSPGDWISGYWTWSLLADLYLVMRVLRRGEGKEKVTHAARHPERSEGSLTNVRGADKLRDSSPSAQNDRGRGKRIDVARALTDDLQKRIRDAYYLATQLKHAEVGLAHLLWALLGSPAVASLLVRLEIDGKGLQERLKHLVAAVHNSPRPSLKSRAGDPLFAEAVKQIFVSAYLDTQRVRSEYVEAHHVFLEIVSADERVAEIFYDLGVDKEKLRNAVRWLEINEELRRRWKQFRGVASRRPKGEMNRAMTALQTQVLDRFSDDLTMLAGRGYLELVVDREKEFEEIFQILQGERKSVLLVGPHGVGKETILQGVAQRMVEEVVPRVLQDRRLVSLSVPKLVAGADLSQAEQRLLHCLTDLNRARNIVLAIPNVHETSAGRGAGGLDLSEVLATELAKGYFVALATTTPEEYRARIEGMALGNAFIKVDIAEPDTVSAIHILESKVATIEYQTKVYFSYGALEKAVELSARYLKDQVLPEKAIDIAKEAAQHVANRRGAKALVRGEDVAEIISAKSHVPVTSVTAKEADKLLNLEKIMHERIIGQDEAVKVVAAALRRARAELREVKRPIANFLFLGPTGVGKTETAKTVAEAYFGSENTMVRIDMSEYQDNASVYRLLGAPGEHGGLLTEPVRKNPFTLVLLDEIEKAHPDILNVFLQMMDDGRLTDSGGRVIDFTNTIIIATSNAERSYFKPEFLNRCDAIITYKPLTEAEILRIAELILAKVATQLEAKGIILRVTEEAVLELAQAGFDPLFGARPLRRVIQERVQDALANLLLTQKLGRRDVVVFDKGGQLRVEKAEKL